MDFDQLFLEHSQYCISWLQKKYAPDCDQYTADDCYMAAFETFMIRAKKGLVEPNNIRAYLLTISKNNYLQSKKTALFPLSPYWEPTDSSATIKEEEHLLDQKRAAYDQAFLQLSAKCQELLSHHYIECYSLKELVSLLGYSSYDVIKDKNRTCKNHLKKQVNALLNKTSEQ